ncbi:PA14 domain-containing protein [uncultured Tateyamaria sp.]|uniref:PA14 domain-containing protein n=1 Tax=uncultured Tateyamaria sp. TaxID=455651 RepID=UPI00260EA021|nr:PA14 domain-containing protein [uncultured Tateyamaria sp.]
MKFFRTVATATALAMVATGAFAAPLKLKPANPQPTGLKQGLAVKYAFPADVKSLSQATRYLKKAKAGKPLSGLDYRDTNNGDDTLTSGQAHHVAAAISGYVKFYSPGTYTIDFLTNDGLDARVGGQTVGYFDGRQSCSETRAVEVEVPQAGWYPLEATYFQRVGSSCLHMRAGKGAPDWMPNAAFGYK